MVTKFGGVGFGQVGRANFDDLHNCCGDGLTISIVTSYAPTGIL